MNRENPKAAETAPQNRFGEPAPFGLGKSQTSTEYRISIGFKDDDGACVDYMGAGSDLKRALAAARVLAGNPAIEIVALFENEVTITRKRLAWFSPVADSSYALAGDTEQTPQDDPVERGQQPSDPHDFKIPVADRSSQEPRERTLADLIAEIPKPLQDLLRAEGAVRWQPIETAPKDGTPILATDGVVTRITQWFEREADHLFPTGIRQFGWAQGQPTLWMPIPALPDPPVETT